MSKYNKVFFYQAKKKFDLKKWSKRLKKVIDHKL